MNLINRGLTISITDQDKIDLKDILNSIGEIGKQSVWKISGAECLGENAEVIHKASDDCEQLSGEEFYKTFSGIYQTLDGDFEAYKPDNFSRWFLIRAIRGDEFDIETEDKELLIKIRASVQDVKDLIY